MGIRRGKQRRLDAAHFLERTIEVPSKQSMSHRCPVPVISGSSCNQSSVGNLAVRTSRTDNGGSLSWSTESEVEAKLETDDQQNARRFI